MKDSEPKRLVVLQTGLFPDAATVEEGIKKLEKRWVVSRHDIAGAARDTAAWNRVLADILTADKIITV